MRISVLHGALACATIACGCDEPIGGGPDVQPGIDALANCDVRAAHAVYEDAYAASSSDPSIALGYAMTDMLLLGEDPDAAAGLALFGFSGGMDPDDLLTGPSALLDTLNRHAPSSEYGDFVEARFPYEPVRGGASGLDLIAPTTTARQVVEHGFAMQARFARLSEAFETAARGAPQAIEIGGICGVGRVELQATELYLLAATWQAVALALQIGRGYSWDFAVRDALDWRDRTPERLRAQAEVLNTHLGAIHDASALPAVAGAWRRLFALLNAAMDAGEAAGAPGPDGLLEWRAYRAGLFAAMGEQGAAAERLSDSVVTAPGLTPEWSGELGPLYRGELDLAAFGRSFEVYEDPMWGDAWIEVDEAPIDAVLMAVLSRSPFDDTLGEVDWTHLDAWSGDDTDWQLTDVPSERPVVSARVPRFIAPTLARYLDAWYFGARP